MQITQIYTDYFQKSSTFLFPLLGIKNNTQYKFNRTYLINSKHAINQCRLYVHYIKENTSSYYDYEEKIIFNNEYYEDFNTINEKEVIYTFNLMKHKEDYFKVLDSTYSLLSEYTKRRIESYFGTNSENYKLVKSFLYPEKYYRNYARLLITKDSDFDNMVNLLKSVKELCSKIDLEKETLNYNLLELAPKL
jgi:hypothetical protein